MGGQIDMRADAAIAGMAGAGAGGGGHVIRRLSPGTTVSAGGPDRGRICASAGELSQAGVRSGLGRGPK